MFDRTDPALRFAQRLEKQLRLKKARLETAETDSPSPPRPAPTPAPPPPPAGPAAATDTVLEADALSATIEELAAVSGRFDPNVLIPATSDEHLRYATLSRLASWSTVHVEGDAKRWLMDCDRRRQTLQRLVQENRLADTLSKALPPTDRFGDMLRKVLRDGTAMTLEDLSRDDLLAVSAAVESLAGIDVPKPDTDTLRRLISQKQFLADYEVLIENGFVGREMELGKLRDFLTREPQGSPSQRPWHGLVLTGLGGAGKSTLLAKFARDIVREETATVVILDFDRPGIDPADTSWLEAEMAGQVGQQYPAIAERVRQLGQASARYKREMNVEQTFIAEKVDVERGLRGAVSELHDALKSVEADARPFLLVLDTFEEVTQRYYAPPLLDWLDEIAESLWPTRLRVIFSGRLFDVGRDVLRNSVVDDIEIAELEPSHAQRLLEMLDLPAPWPVRLANSDVLPRRPLELKLLARLVIEGSPSSIDELEAELRSGGKAARDLFAGLVYRRVLLRIRDNTARTLAYPGLVLRYVTPPLVQHVLAPSLDMPSMDEEEANRALNALAGYDWLASRLPNGEVWHRRDLRRSMLKAMIAEARDSAERISRNAVEHFSRFTDDRSAAEAVYHRLLLVRSRADLEPFDLDELRNASEHIAGDIADLPPESGALLRFASGQEVGPSDVPLLPARHIESAYHATGANCVRSRRFGLARRLCQAVRLEGLIPADVPVEAWEIETLFATASWDILQTQVARLRPSAKVFSDVADVAEMIFPQAILSPSLVDRRNLEAALSEAIGSRRRKGDDAHRQTVLSRLSVSLVRLDWDSRFSDEIRSSIAKLLQPLRSQVRDGSNPLFDRRMLLLEMVSGTTDSARSTVPISALTVTLNPQSVRQLAERARALVTDDDLPSTRQLLSDITNVLAHGKRGRHTVRTILSTVNAMETIDTKRRSAVRVPFGRLRDLDDWLLLRGPDPEFRDPCRFALLDAFDDDAGRRQLGDIFAAAVPLTTLDLEPDAFVEAIGQDPEHALESYVEIADRAGVMQDLLERANQQRPTKKLGLVADAYAQWIAAVHHAFTSTRPDRSSL